MNPSWARETSAEIHRRLLTSGYAHRGDYRIDANDPYFFSNALDQVLAKTFDRKYPMARAREFVNILPAEYGASEIVYTGYDAVGTARIKANGATDIPLVDVSGAQARVPIATNWDGAPWTIEELAASGKAGGPPIDQSRMAAARKFIELRYDLQLRFGEPLLNTTGLLNNADVDTFSLPVGDWANAGTTGDEIIEDVIALEDDIGTDSFGTHEATTLLVDSLGWRYLSSKTVGTDGSKTALAELRDRLPNVEIIRWRALDTAGTGVTIDTGLDGDPMMLMYQRTADEGPWSAVAREASPEAPERHLANFLVMWLQWIYPGVTFPYPMAARYVENHIA